MRIWMIFATIMALLPTAASYAQSPLITVEPLQTPAQSLAEDATEYARQYAVPPDEAIHRLKAQEDSVATTDQLRDLYRDRLAGIVVEHKPAFRIVILLTGTEPVPDAAVAAGGITVPIIFATGAPATRDNILAAIAEHQAEIRASLPYPPGMGVDGRTGRLAVVVRGQDVAAEGLDAMQKRLETMTGVPVTIRTLAGTEQNLGIEGGSRVAGRYPDDKQRYVCTTGFVVTDGTRTDITTAAHCPDDLAFIAPDGKATPLTMIGAWGARYQDVQIHIRADGSDEALSPLFHADSPKHVVRRLTTWRNRTSTRVGDFVCHRGESSGYSCAEVDYVDYAPPGDLCAGPCEPYWVAVKGPHCKGGDSGSPVFLGTIAFGTVKGASYLNGGCGLYFYMSTDYLPPGWTLLH